jgi:hypothetical protein
MAINPQIPLMAGQGVTPVKSRLQVEQEVLGLRNAQQANQMNQMAIEDRGIQRQQSEAESKQRIQESISRMSESQRKAAFEHVQELGKASEWILSQPPERMQEAYDYAANTIPGLEKFKGMKVNPQELQMFASQARAFGKELAPQKWNKPFEAKDPKTGKEVFVAYDDAGNTKTVEGYVPTTKTPLVSVNTGAKEAFKDETTLRKEYNDEIKGFRTVKDAYKRIEVAGKENSAASDISLIYGYMKLLDPGSVVREGEFATAQNAAGIPDRIRAAYNKAMSGERLAPGTKADFLRQSDLIFEQALASQKSVAERYKSIADQYKLNPSNVVTEEGGKGAAPGAPKAGQAEDGFTFMGGDPADPKNWKKVK